MARVDNPIPGFDPAQNITVTRVTRNAWGTGIEFDLPATIARGDAAGMRCTVERFTDNSVHRISYLLIRRNDASTIRMNRSYTLLLTQKIGRREVFPLAALDAYMSALQPTPPDLTVCPNCGKHDFRIAAIEQVRGTCELIVADGTAEFGGETDLDWNENTTTGYQCMDCETVLPDTYADALDTMLGITRKKG